MKSDVSKNRLLAMDLDRTLLPNGKDPYDGSIRLLFKPVQKIGLPTVYVSGRNLRLFRKAKREYDLPNPDYLIASVGTELYVKKDGTLKKDISWNKAVLEKSPGWSYADAVKAVKGAKISDLKIQGKAKQNKFKASFYIYADSAKKRKNRAGVAKKALKKAGVPARVIYSYDPLLEAGLLDVLPSGADKSLALEFVRKKLGLSKKQVIYCGDSGNDIAPFSAGYKTILVKNAPANIKSLVRTKAKKTGRTKDLYIAGGNGFLNGNYSSGIIEGLLHFGIISEEDAFAVRPRKRS